MLKKINRYVPAASMVIFPIALLAAALHIAMCESAALSDFINKYPGAFYRFISSKISGVLPFSLSEAILLFSPVIIAAACVLLTRYCKGGRRQTVRCFTGILSFAALIYCLFVISVVPGYNGLGLAAQLSLTESKVSADELYETITAVTDGVNAEADSVDFIRGDKSVMPWELSGMTAELNSCYDRLSDEYGFINGFSSRVKPLVISPYMTYTHLSGMYTFFTGESNLNTNYPDYINVYTAAHEMAHQRGISKEDEANFVAFLVCKDSDSAYVRYSAYLNMYSYLSSALYKASPELYTKAAAALDPRVADELYAYSRFFDKYRDSGASKVSDAVNNAYLVSQGTSGVASYGMVVDLAVAYYSR